MPNMKKRVGNAHDRKEKVRPVTRALAKPALSALQVRKAARRAHNKAVLAQMEECCANGIPCIPTEPPSRGEKGSGKRPLNGLSKFDASTDPNVFRQRVKGVKSFGLAILTGADSNIVIIDRDVPGGRAQLAKLEERLGKLPKTVTSITGSGGRHYFFRPSGGSMKTAKLALKIDFLADKSMAKIPPSASAKENYRWAPGKAPGEIKIADLPREWVGELSRSGRSKACQTHGIVHEGGRNQKLTQQAGILAAKGIRGKELRRHLEDFNRENCIPPLDDDEVRNVARSIDHRADENEAEPAVRVAKKLLEKEFAGGAHLICAKDYRFYNYTGKCWTDLALPLLKQRIVTTATAVSAIGRIGPLVREVTDYLRIICARDGDPLHFEKAPPAIINLANGELHLREDGDHKLKEHSPKSGLRHIIDVNYDPEAACPEFDKALQDIFSKAKDPDRVIAFFLEFFGYVLQPKRDRALFLIAYGRGANGKTKLFGLVVSLLGRHLVHFGQVQDLDGSRFALGSLHGKQLFIDDDVKTNLKLSDGLLKKLSEAKMMTGEVKFGPTFEFECRALPVLLTNNFPSVNDISDGFLRRLHVVQFGRQFLGAAQDSNLFDRIAKNEMSGVLNRALEGWVRLVRNGKFTVGADMLHARTELLRQANPLKGFVDEDWVVDEKGRVKLLDFYSEYRRWSVVNGYSMTQSMPIVRRNIEHMGFRVPRVGAGRTIFGLRAR